jgi:glycine cleavage system aminomethyltransferase T
MNVAVTRDDNFSIRSGTRDVFRVQIQGPDALPLMKEVTDNTLPEISFFGIGEFKIAGYDVRALRHGMAGEPGFEIYGPWEIQAQVRAALERTGEKYGMRKVGAMAYSTTAQESGWMPMPLPAIYHSAEMKPYREWLNQFYLETVASLGGSFVSDNIVDYYVDPVEVGYKSLIDFNHDFMGREALRDKVASPRRRKVTLEWNNDDVLACLGSSLTTPGSGGMYMKLPNPMFATFQSDAILKSGKPAGISQWLAFSANANRVISLSLVDIEHAEPGTEVIVLWGEPNSTRRPVDKHQVREIRAKVAPAPYFEKVIKTRVQ